MRGRFGWGLREGLASGLEGLFHAEGGGVAGFEAEGVGDVGGGGGELVGVELEAGEDEVGGGVGVEADGGFGLGAGFGGVAALGADLGEADVSVEAAWVCGDGGLELFFGLGEESLGEVVAAFEDVLGRALGRGEGGEAELADLVELKGGLAEGGFGVGAAEALEGSKGGVAGASGGEGEAAGGEAVAELLDFGVVGVELEGGFGFAGGAGGVVLTKEGEGEVVAEVGVVGVGGDGSLEEGGGVVALAAAGDGLVVDDLGEGEAGGDKGEGGLGLGVVVGVEAAEAEEELGFEGAAVGGRNPGEGGGGAIVVALGVEGFAEGEDGGVVGGGFLDGEAEALDAFLGVGGVDAADVVLKGAELDAGGGGEKGGKGDGELGVDVAGDLPGEGVFDVEESGELAGVGEGRGEAELVDAEDLGLDGDAGAFGGEVADDDEVGVQGFARCGWWWRERGGSRREGRGGRGRRGGLRG